MLLFRCEIQSTTWASNLCLSFLAWAVADIAGGRRGLRGVSSRSPGAQRGQKHGFRKVRGTKEVAGKQQQTRGLKNTAPDHRSPLLGTSGKIHVFIDVYYSRQFQKCLVSRVNALQFTSMLLQWAGMTKNWPGDCNRMGKCIRELKKQRPNRHVLGLDLPQDFFTWHCNQICSALVTGTHWWTYKF